MNAQRKTIKLQSNAVGEYLVLADGEPIGKVQRRRTPTGTQSGATYAIWTARSADGRDVQQVGDYSAPGGPVFVLTDRWQDRCNHTTRRDAVAALVRAVSA